MWNIEDAGPHKPGPEAFFARMQSTHFPVYGLTGHPFNLSISSYGEGWFGNQHTLYSFTLIFSSPRTPAEQSIFEITSADASVEGKTSGIVFRLPDAPDPSRAFRRYHLTQKELEQIAPPVVWRGTLSLESIEFATKLVVWPSPRQYAKFLLRSTQTILSGQASGQSLEELKQCLQTLQIINYHDDILRQYRATIDQDTR